MAVQLGNMVGTFKSKSTKPRSTTTSHTLYSTWRSDFLHCMNFSIQVNTRANFLFTPSLMFYALSNYPSNIEVSHNLKNPFTRAARMLFPSSWTHRQTYRDEIYSLQILLSRTQAGPGRAFKQEQEEISPNYVQR